MKRPRPRPDPRRLALWLPGAAGALLRESGRGSEVAVRATAHANASASSQAAAMAEAVRAARAILSRSPPVVHLSSAIDNMLRGEQAYGDPKCPCVGLDGLVGRTTVSIEGEVVEFPADLGGQCKTWDDGYHPRCEAGESAPWCGEAWCYVDPCHCDLPATPTLSEYMPKAEYQGKPVHFSYATCNSLDTWTRGHARRPLADAAAICSKEQDEKVWGKRSCSCIGIGERTGATEVQFGQDLTPYPTGVGSKCEAWDWEHHPDCHKLNAPEWCSKKWCYVDPCSCDLAVGSKESVYLNGSTHQGRPLHYSYATCGQEEVSVGNAAKTACMRLSRSSCEDDGTRHCKWDHANSSCTAWGLPLLCEAALETRSGAARCRSVFGLLSLIGGALVL